MPAIFPAGPSATILGSLVGFALLVGLLAALGVLQPGINTIGWLLKELIRRGFVLWESTLGWMPWPMFAAFIATVLIAGGLAADGYSFLTAITALLALYAGAISCLAYIHLDFERIAVERGYKAITDPDQGQELAVEYIRHSHRARWPLLAAAALAFVGGFTLLNKAIFLALGPDQTWYDLQGLPGSVADFTAYSIISLYNAVDLLDVLAKNRIFNLPHVTATNWITRTLLVVYKMFFAFVLVQQLLSAFRRSGQLGQLITDFWSPNLPIHQRARTALPLFGASAVIPLMKSLAVAPKVTREMRDELPNLLASAGPTAIPILARFLRDPNERVRMAAAATLGKLGGRRTLSRLVRLARDPSDAVRLAAIEAIGAIAATRTNEADASGGLFGWFWSIFDSRRRAMSHALSALIAACRDTSPAVRCHALEALGELGAFAMEALPAIRAALHDEDEEVEDRAVDALAKIAGPEAVPDLVDLCGNARATARLAAARGLGQLGPRAMGGAEAAAQLMMDRDERVCEAAANALARIGEFPPTAAVVLEQGLRHQDSVIRARVAASLGQLGPIAGPLAGALTKALDDPSDAVRSEAITALGKIGVPIPEAVARLKQALTDDDNWVTALAAEALGNMGGTGRDSADALAAALRHPTPQVRANAAAALGKLGPAATSALPGLVRAVSDKDAEVRQSAARALGLIRSGSPPVLAALRKSLTDNDGPVRANAVAALRELGKLSESDCVTLLRDGSDSVRIEALEALPRLESLSEETLAEACKCLRDDDGPEVRVHAASVLGAVGRPSEVACAALLEASRTGEIALRVEALRSLAELSCPVAPEAFAEGLNDTSPEVRRAAVLGWTKAAAATEGAVHSLVLALRDADAIVRSTAAFALGRHSELASEAVEPLLVCLEDEEDRVRFHAVVALRKSGEVAALDALTKCLSDDSLRVRLAAARSLLRHRPDDEAALKVVEEALDSDDEAVSRLARQVLGRTE